MSTTEAVAAESAELLVGPAIAVPRAAPARGGRWGTRLAALAKRQAMLHQGLLSIFDQALSSGASFITVVIIGRTCTTEELGIYYLMLSIVLALIGIQDNVIVAPYTIFGARYRGRALAEFTGSMWIHRLTLTVVAEIALLAMVAAAFVYSDTAVVWGLASLVLFVPLLLYREGIRRFAFARLRPMTAVAVDATVVTLQLGGLLLLGWLGRLSAFVVFAVMGLACAVACAGWYWFERQPVRVVRTRLWPDWVHNWSFAKWAFTCFLFGSTTPFIMPWLLNLADGPSAAGVLGACGTLVGVTNILIIGASNILTPKAAHAFSQSGVPGLRKILLVTGGLFTLLLGSLCVGAFVTGDRLSVLVYGAEFADTGGILTAMTGNALAISLSVVAGNGLWALGQPRLNFVADVVSLFATLVLSVVLIPPWGALGAALAALVGTSAGAAVRIGVLQRAMRAIPSTSTAL